MKKEQAKAFIHALFGAREGEYCYVDNCPFAVTIMEQHTGRSENHNERMNRAVPFLAEVVAALQQEPKP